ncbi:hypothetical protein OpiT1DRAFT_02320 [Opitutaceae bacterium TAV1]|nr:hypothetical protein OpiT1DRAFT_02320 [Opitutaceae bacterium TAV1]
MTGQRRGRKAIFDADFAKEPPGAGAGKIALPDLAGMLPGTAFRMTLIIRDSLVNPPTWFASFRDLTLYCNVFLKDDIVIESEDPDPYVRWMRPRGGMDFVEDFVRPGSEDGVRLDTEHNYPRSVITDRIAPENVHRLIGMIRGCRGL